MFSTDITIGGLTTNTQNTSSTMYLFKKYFQSESADIKGQPYFQHFHCDVGGIPFMGALCQLETC